MLPVLCLLTSLPASSPAVGAGQAAPELSIRAFIGDLAAQRFVEWTGELEKSEDAGAITRWRARLKDEAGRQAAVSFRGECVHDGEVDRWSYEIANHQPGATICGVTFPRIGGVRLGDSWAENRILWPSKYTGALIDDLTSSEGFVKQSRLACKGVDHLYGRYQGDLCLPFFVQLSRRESFGIMVLDPTHEVLTLVGNRTKAGMRYEVQTHPKIRPGERWRFGTIEVFRHPHADWHVPADRYRRWLVEQGFKPSRQAGDVAALMYGRWDGLRPAEVIRWAKAVDVKEVCLWVQLYGRGDRYYPCYFPPPKLGIEGMTTKLRALRKAGLSPYFYTNGYLLSPLQTAADARAFTTKYPKQYPDWLARNDTGYAETVARFRAAANDFAGDWLQTPGGILPLRVRRVNFRWGEYPLYFWHRRPFWAACVGTTRWRKLFRDVARLHARMGARGLYLDQVAAIRPELCSAPGHGHDRDTFGFWNRAYLRLLNETKAVGAAREPGFFLEAEGASDLYARYIDRYLCNFRPPPPGDLRWSRFFRYTVPWARFDCGQFPLTDAAAMEKNIERTLLLGAVFRLSGGGPTGPDDAHEARLTSESARLLRAAIQTRRRLAAFIEGGRYMDDVGLETTGCSAARWFRAGSGALIAAQAQNENAEVRLRLPGSLTIRSAFRLDWEDGSTAEVAVRTAGNQIRVTPLRRGLNLVVLLTGAEGIPEVRPSPAPTPP